MVITRHGCSWPGPRSATSLVAPLQAFLDTLAVERGLSTHTVEAYRRGLLHHFRFLVSTGHTDPGGVEELQLILYLGALRRTNLAPATVVRRLSRCRAFYRHLVREEVIVADPTAHLPPPPPPPPPSRAHR